MGDEGVMGGEDGAEGEGMAVRVGDGRVAGGGPRLSGVRLVAWDVVVTDGARGEGGGAGEAGGGGGGGGALAGGAVTCEA